MSSTDALRFPIRDHVFGPTSYGTVIRIHAVTVTREPSYTEMDADYGRAQIEADLQLETGERVRAEAQIALWNARVSDLPAHLMAHPQEWRLTGLRPSFRLVSPTKTVATPSGPIVQTYPVRASLLGASLAATLVRIRDVTVTEEPNYTEMDSGYGRATMAVDVRLPTGEMVQANATIAIWNTRVSDVPRHLMANPGAWRLTGLRPSFRVADADLAVFNAALQQGPTAAAAATQGGGAEEPPRDPAPATRAATVSASSGTSRPQSRSRGR